MNNKMRHFEPSPPFGVLVHPCGVSRADNALECFFGCRNEAVLTCARAILGSGCDCAEFVTLSTFTRCVRENQIFREC